jgi:predicted PurR-regulated permease PerM
LRDVLWIVFISAFVALLLSPFVDRLRRWKCPEILGILITFFAVFLTGILFFASIVPLFIGLVDDSKTYIVRSVDYAQKQAVLGFPVLNDLPLQAGSLIRKEVDLKKIQDIILDNNRSQIVTKNLISNIDTIKNIAQQGWTQVSSLSLTVATGVTTFLTNISLFLLLTFFIILERRSLLKWFFDLLPSDLGHYFKSREYRIGKAIHSWLRGQLFLALFMFAINFIGLYIGQYLGIPVKNIFSLSLIAGAMEFVPYAGPVIAFFIGTLTVLVSPEVTWWSLVGIMALYFIFQQLEGNIMVPLVMSRTLSLSSLYILIMTIIGGALGGAIGVLLAIPLASVLHIFYHDWMHYRRTLHTSL